MRGFRPRPKRSKLPEAGLSAKPMGMRALVLEDEKYFSDEDEFEGLFYSEREKDYVKKFNKITEPHQQTQNVQRHNILQPKQRQESDPPTRPGQPRRQNQGAPSVVVPNLPASAREEKNDVEEDVPKMKKGSILTKEYAQSGISKVFKGSIVALNNWRKMKVEGLESTQLKEVVSLHLQKKGIVQINPDAFQSFSSLAHLYLYDNNIMGMNGFSSLPQLESLHLSGNRINRIQDLEGSFNLRQLYLGHNEIEVIEGLENLSMLVELHIEDQKLPREQPLIFCPNSLDTISKKLKVLNTSGNQLESIEDLLCMDVLDTLNLSRNKLTNLDNVSEILRTLRQLRVLDMRNQLSSQLKRDPKYKEKILGFCGGIELLDGKEVNDNQKKTLQRLCAIKAMRIRNQQFKPNNKTSHPAHQVTSFPGAFQSQIYPDQMMQNRRATMSMMMPVSIEVNDVPEIFVYSTPISMSPTPDHHHYPSSRLSAAPQDVPHDEDGISDAEISIQQEVADLYAARSNLEHEQDEESETDKMSEMAKIIFRLSNLSPSNDGLGKSSRSDISLSHYWSNSRGHGDRFSRFKESRPLSPLEVDVKSSKKSASITNKSRSVDGLRVARRVMARKLPPRRSIGAGRTLSPLEELPTPDSTVRDLNLEGRNELSSAQSLQPSTCSLPPLPYSSKMNKGTVAFMPSVTKLKEKPLNFKR